MFMHMSRVFVRTRRMCKTSVALLSRLTPSKISTWLRIIGMVVSCCDAIGNVLLTSFWSHCRAHPRVLWRSKLRNTYCTLDFAKDCFRLPSWNTRVNTSILRWAIVTRRPCYISRHRSVFCCWLCTHLRLSEWGWLLINKQVFGMIRCVMQRLAPALTIILRLVRGPEHVYPVSLILLYFACQYINGCFYPSYWR